jgi:predicted ArsR family transcriptional regulator
VTTARQRVLAHLKKTRTATAREIARALKMSAPNVRHHLSVLCSDGRVEVARVNRLGRKGRPEKQYSPAVHDDNLSVLASALLTEAGTKLKLDSLAKRVLDPDSFAGLSIPKRLRLLIEKLNEMNYQARWEAGAAGPRLIFGQCPYARVIAGHPELCKMDVAMLEAALGRAVVRSSKNDVRSRASCPFLFEVR